MFAIIAAFLNTLPLLPLLLLNPAPTARPNIVFILADDLGQGNLSCYGADRFRTPEIDRLAHEGLRLTRFHTAPLCGPSRALIISGRYAFRTGATNQDACAEIDRSELILPQMLRQAGYATGFVGKWGQLTGTARAAGFEDCLTFRGSGVYWKPSAGEQLYDLNGATRSLQEGEYMPQLMQQHALQFLKSNRDRPFFLYYSLSHVHGELTRTPLSGASPDDLMAENLLWMDAQIGELRAALEELGLAKQTLLIFMGDNGTGKGQADRATIGGRMLAGSKGTMQDGGCLVPFICCWPGQVPAGRVSAQLVDATDLVPTFTALVGGSLKQAPPVDGRSFEWLLRGREPQPETQRQWVYSQLARMWFVRNDRWKLDQSGNLFELTDAPFAEQLITADQESAAATTARRQLSAVLGELNPAGGKLDQGDGTGRHAKRKKSQ
jgi:arylsulfatase A